MLWVKAFHVIFMVSWFAALFYLPRLFVYHASSSDDISNERFKIMERKLFYGIMTPAALVTAILGFWMLFEYAWQAYSSMRWLHIKLVIVALLFVYHFYCWKLVKLFKEDKNTHSHVYYRWFNEIPVFMLMGITILVIVKPI
ncbi:MAG: protoporphyrinogen oxidase HemJ [gamma proteobacterium symbiont of Bathyaustriella thionipta]|nr:protoporphyrinogen oxidase HemJ [gamma proteobacterium symbiont of Bathyaustriella thionipta]MCU7950411.1 protoporphyrinogen oxidase HemJ [gamma proteobacterium symbiont of Bathyaustriella thionipta]MCU7953346.1 protoporphyrinogen oxidase HemJ [gamma proteobacterium symbiont of Bathyaustriella thionipta]MCU7956914.1 protoporphyrinogen oxidase HemJ [gamma proteobacterium symbiont of Bathyaustriella thionipta]MCU7968142.1 protoporphyrinogen oxidase HemJ [gamma proteobacterium symbiont of Bathy